MRSHQDIEKFFAVSNSRIMIPSHYKSKNKIESYGDWDFYIYRAKKLRFSREEFDSFCGENDSPSPNPNIVDLKTLLQWSSIYFVDSQGNEIKDFVFFPLFGALEEFHVFREDGNSKTVTCEDAQYFYYFTYFTS